MTARTASSNSKPKTVKLPEKSNAKGKLKRLGGSDSDDWNKVLINQTMQTLWVKHSDDDEQQELVKAAAAALAGMELNDELEGMLAAQLIAAHNAAMECYRRAMLGEQTFEGRKENLNRPTSFPAPGRPCWTPSTSIGARGSKESPWSMSTSMLVGKLSLGQSSNRGVGIETEVTNNPMQGKLPMHLSQRCGARTRSGKPCQSAAMANSRCRMHGGKSPGAPVGNRNALKHGRFTSEAIARRRELASLIRAMRILAQEVSD